MSQGIVRIVMDLFVTENRRRFLKHMAFGTAMFSTPGLFAEQLLLTPSQTEGPFYPDKLPLDTDNDLLVINDGITPAVGQVTYLSGRVLSSSGDPIRNAVVEIWQADQRGAYIHSRSFNGEKRDGNFQGFGRFLTGSNGEYLFRTIKPVPYVGRTPHIHFAINMHGKRVLTTQLYVQDEPLNEKDGIYQQLGNAKAKAAVTKEFVPLKGGRANELAAAFDIVLGVTPEDPS
jgi:protocatechuate 3,4-dioxygenase beta subunit